MIESKGADPAPSKKSGTDWVEIFDLSLMPAPPLQFHDMVQDDS